MSVNDRESVDVVVVGAGAGGAAAARELAAAGLAVLILEQGQRLTARDFTQREEEMIPRLFQEGGGRTTTDKGIAVLQGHGVGGSTLHNLNLCKRIPDALLERWEEEFLLPGLRERLAPHYAAVEAELGVQQVEDHQVNRHNQLFAAGCAVLGLPTARLHHNRRGCVGSGFCELGCAYDAKMNAARVLVPAAEALGARVWTGARVERLRHRFGAVDGVDVRVEGPGGSRRVRVDARAVVLGASATGSAALVLASGLGDRHGRVGAGLHLHPGCSVGAVFDEPVLAWQGVPQSIECTALLDPIDPARRVWLLPAFAHPAGAAGLMPGHGPSMMRWMRQYPHLAAASPMLHDHGHGRVTATRDGSPRIHYTLDPADGRALAQGIDQLARIWLAAGARAVLLPWAGGIEVHDVDGLRASQDRLPAPLDPPLVAVHPMGGLSMAGDPQRGAVDHDGRFYGARGLYVADGSLFPTSTGGPPQLTIYALGRMVGQAAAQDLGAGL
jgi:choline dehydrogenase-like flavoprotein